MTVRLCSLCGLHPRRVSRSGREHAHCHQCNRERVQASRDKRLAENPEGWRASRREVASAWRDRNREHVRAAGRDQQLKRLYGLTRAEFLKLVEGQANKCAICAKVVDKLHVDHNHTTGQIRELLCRECNLGLGHFADDPRRLSIAAEYLRKHVTREGQHEEGTQSA